MWNSPVGEFRDVVRAGVVNVREAAEHFKRDFDHPALIAGIGAGGEGERCAGVVAPYEVGGSWFGPWGAGFRRCGALYAGG